MKWVELFFETVFALGALYAILKGDGTLSKYMLLLGVAVGLLLWRITRKD